MIAPEKGEQDLQACLVKKVAGGALLPWKLRQALAHACAMGKSRYMQWGECSGIHNTQQGEKQGQDGAWREQAELWHKQPVHQLQWCPTAVLANLQASNVKMHVQSEGKWTQKAGTIQLPRKISHR